jgi:enoyl-CoA hydratase
VKRGLFSAAGGTLLSTRIPLALALEMGLTGRPFSADQALAAGLVNRKVQPDELIPTAMELATEISANGPIAVRLTKKLMRAAVTDGPEAAHANPEEVSSVFDSADAKEGAMAFFEKRPAEFTGT